MYQPEVAVLLSSGNTSEKWNFQAREQSKSHDDYTGYRQRHIFKKHLFG